MSAGVTEIIPPSVFHISSPTVCHCLRLLSIKSDCQYLDGSLTLSVAAQDTNKIIGAKTESRCINFILKLRVN